jgi:hypothetical protein
MKIGIATGINCKPICWNENPIITIANEKKITFKIFFGQRAFAQLKFD